MTAPIVLCHANACAYFAYDGSIAHDAANFRGRGCVNSRSQTVRTRRGQLQLGCEHRVDLACEKYRTVLSMVMTRVDATDGHGGSQQVRLQACDQLPGRELEGGKLEEEEEERAEERERRLRLHDNVLARRRATPATATPANQSIT